MNDQRDIIAGWALVISVIDSGIVADHEGLKHLLEHWSDGYADDRTRLAVRYMQTMHKTLNLEKNRTKGHWGDLSAMDHFELLEREVQELKGALWNFSHGGPISRVIEEASDVGNVAAMVADTAQSGALL